MIRTTSILAGALLLSIAALPGCADIDDEELEGEAAEAAEAVTKGRIIVRRFDSPAPPIDKWGYDIKQPGRAKALRPGLAKEIFGEIGLNMIRVAVWAADAHPRRGVGAIKEAVYADDITAIENAKAANPKVDVFASVKLLAKKSFPAWVENGSGVDPDKYAELLEDYLEYMNAKGITIDWLGVDNERKFNEGNITPAKYNQIVGNVKAWCKKKGIKEPGFIGAEDYGPKEDLPWLKTLWETPAKFGHVDHVGVHTYSKHRNDEYVSALKALSNNTHGKSLWDTELHWNDRDDDGGVQFDDIKPGLLSVFDHVDTGFRAMSWWAFQPRSRKTKSAFVMSELVSSTLGASPLATDDMDGKAVGPGKLNSRAFKNGPKQVTLWVGNYDDKTQKDQWAEIKGETIAAASYVQWSRESSVSGKTGEAKVVAKNSSCFSMTYPKNTITRVTVTLK